MLLNHQILVRLAVWGLSTLTLGACGQQGPLYLPDTGGAYRATLPEALTPQFGTRNVIATPPASTPIPQPAASGAQTP